MNDARAGDVVVTDRPDRRRFEVAVDDTVAGFVQYVRKGDRLVLVHTEIKPEFEGRGLGSVLARAALDAARAAGDPVVPLCPFVESFIERHPEYDDLVDHEMLAALEKSARRA